MVLKLYTFLLQILTRDIADEAMIHFITSEFLVWFSQPWKCIQHHTRHNIPEKHSEENCVDCVVGEPSDLKCFHCLSDCPRNKQRQNASHQAIAHFLRLFLVNVLHVVAEGNRAEDKGKNNAHETNVEEALSTSCDGLEDVGEEDRLTEDIDYMDEEEWGMIECSQEGNTYKQDKPIKFTAVVKLLFFAFFFGRDKAKFL